MHPRGTFTLNAIILLDDGDMFSLVPLLATCCSYFTVTLSRPIIFKAPAHSVLCTAKLVNVTQKTAA